MSLLASSCRRLATKAPKWRVASSGKGRTGGRTASAKRAITAASRRLVQLAHRLPELVDFGREIGSGQLGRGQEVAEIAAARSQRPGIS